MLWAFASLKHLEPRMLDAAATVAMRWIQEFTPQTIANTAWAFGALEMRHDGLLAALTAEASRRSASFSTDQRRLLTHALSSLETLAGQ